MNPAATVGVYAGALALVFAAAVGVGNAVGPVATVSSDTASHSTSSHSTSSGADDAHGGEDANTLASSDADLAPGGLAVAQDGYILRVEDTTLAAGTPSTFGFSITGPDGEPLTRYTRSHDKDLHLIVVRRDLTGYQHLHPTRDAQGRWTVPLTLAQPGPYKVFTDFTPAGSEQALTLAADLTAPGSYTPVPLPASSDVASVDGYDVTLDGDLVAGTSSKLTLTVRRDGEPVTDLEPYLGAYGHLVALRDGDLAYLHVHPDGAPAASGTTAGPDITFYADVPSPATYRLFLDFSHGGAVRTAELTADARRDTGDTTTDTADTSDADQAPAGHGGGTDSH